MSALSSLKGRCIYVWKLEPALKAALGVEGFVLKAKKAQFSSVWIKVAEGDKRYPNITGDMEEKFKQVVKELNREDIAVWGWHVPHAATTTSAVKEAEVVAAIAKDFGLAGVLMDAEAGAAFFEGDANTADTYAKKLNELLALENKGLAISSHDIPSSFPKFPFNAFAQHATVNAPQVYYGGSPSVTNRLDRAINANHHLNIPFIPVGAGWIGDGGGCETASACAERALSFMELVRTHNFQGYSFWHWQGIPEKLWEVFFSNPVNLSSIITESKSKSSDVEHIKDLIDAGRNKLVAAQKIAKKAWADFPHNGCAANLSALMQLAGIDVPMTLGAGKLAQRIENRGWKRVKVGGQQAGDVGVTFDNCDPPGADHIYLVLDVIDADKMAIADNQDKEPHTRYASGHGKTRTEYFLRAV